MMQVSYGRAGEMAEQRYRAVLEVGVGVPVTEVAERYGVSRQSVQTWLVRYWQEGIAGRGSSSCSAAAMARISSAPRWNNDLRGPKPLVAPKLR